MYRPTSNNSYCRVQCCPASVVVKLEVSRRPGSKVTRVECNNHRSAVTGEQEAYADLKVDQFEISACTKFQRRIKKNRFVINQTKFLSIKVSFSLFSYFSHSSLYSHFTFLLIANVRRVVIQASSVQATLSEVDDFQGYKIKTRPMY